MPVQREGNKESFRRVLSSDGFELASWTAKPTGACRGVVVLCHGLTTGAADDGAFLPVRDALLARGFATARFDARCHGDTGGDWSTLSLRGWGEDIEAVCGHVIANHPGSPVAILATSFAAGPAVAAANRLRATSTLVVWNGALDYASIFLDPRFESAQVALATRDDPRLPEWAAMRLPWSRNVPLPHSLIEEFRAARTLDELASLRMPVLAIHGTRDRFVPISTTQEALDRCRGATFQRVPLAGHGFRFFRRFVLRRTLAWLERQSVAASAMSTI